MKALKILVLGSAIVIASAPGNAVTPPPSHELCMATATAVCTDNNNLGYPDFQQCGLAVYNDCMGVEQGSGGDGTIPDAPICHVGGRIDEGSGIDPEEDCQP